MEAPPFDLQAVEAGITGTEFARRLMHFPVVESTNTLAVEAAQVGAREGVWIADQQLAGRGRGGHTWHSAPGNGLYVSALTAPTLPAPLALLLSLSTGLAAKRAIEETTNLAADIRWPNDILIGERKCGGILVETAVDAEGMLRYAVIGIGINVNHATFPPELERQATSLRIEAGAAPAREVLLAALLRALDDEIHLLIQQSLGVHNGKGVHNGEGVIARFTAASSWVCGKAVSVAEDGGYTGITTGLDTRGFLQVRSGDGTLRTVLSGGVRAR